MKWNLTKKKPRHPRFYFQPLEHFFFFFFTFIFIFFFLFIFFKPKGPTPPPTTATPMPIIDLFFSHQSITKDDRRRPLEGRLSIVDRFAYRWSFLNYRYLWIAFPGFGESIGTFIFFFQFPKKRRKKKKRKRCRQRIGRRPMANGRFFSFFFLLRLDWFVLVLPVARAGAVDDASEIRRRRDASLGCRRLRRHFMFTGFYWVSLGFIGMYLVFTGFYLVLPSFTGSYWVLPSST